MLAVEEAARNASRIAVTGLMNCQNLPESTTQERELKETLTTIALSRIAKTSMDLMEAQKVTSLFHAGTATK